MTRTTADSSMRVVGHLFIMILMALTTIPQPLLVVSELGRPGMTGHARHGGMSGLPICFFIDGRHLLGGHLLGAAPLIAVAVKAEPLDSFTILLTIRRRETVTNHAGFVLFHRRRQRFVPLMAGAALLSDGHGGVDSSLAKSRLVVRLVAASAVPVTRTIVDLLGAMPTPIQVVKNIIVTGKATIRVEQARRLSVNLGGIGMTCLIGCILVAVQTAILAMGGNVVSVRVQIPRFPGLCRADPEEGNTCNEEKLKSVH